MKTETVNYQAADIELKGYLAFPDEEKAPLVLIAHTWAGKDDFVHERAEDLAALGYVGFAVDMYGNGKVGSSTEENQSLMEPLLSDRVACCHCESERARPDDASKASRNATSASSRAPRIQSVLVVRMAYMSQEPRKIVRKRSPRQDV